MASAENRLGTTHCPLRSEPPKIAMALVPAGTPPIRSGAAEVR
jgi:hypothetical protein